MTMLHFRGGGSLDGAELQLPAHVPGVVTIEREGGESHYILDSITRTAWFTGFNEQGRDMGKLWRQLADAARAEAEAIEAASAAKGCSSCGRVFGSPGAFAVAHDGRCLPDHMIESMLTEISGVWCARGSDAALR